MTLPDDHPTGHDALARVLPSTWAVHAGRASIGGIAVGDLADRYGTPLYVVDVDHLRSRMDAYRRAFGADTVLAFAAKSFFCVAMARLLAAGDWWVDVVSAGEISVARRGGVPGERLLFHGNYKTDEEMSLAVAHDVGRVIVDHPAEVVRLERAAVRSGRPLDVLVRINLEVGADTHHKIRTSGVDQHFGMSPDEADSALSAVAGSRLLRVAGAHTHVGSQIVDPGTFAAAASSLGGFVARRRPAFPEVADLDIGGGLAVPYRRGDPAGEVDRLADAVRESLSSVGGLGAHRLMVEPGRSVVANAGVTVYRIGVRKASSEGPPFLAVDGGISDNPRPALYDARYETVLPERADAPHDHRFRVVGRHCEPGDVVVADALLPGDAGPGELVVVPVTGAYAYSMSSRYNLVPRPAVVFVDRGVAEVAVKRESVDDLP